MNPSGTQLLERLSELLDLADKNSLSKQNQEDSVSALSKLVETNKKNAEIALEMIPRFPYMVGSAVLAKKWAYLQVLGLPLLKILGSEKFSSPQCKRLRLSLSRSLLASSPESALQVLLGLFKEMAQKNAEIPTVKSMQSINIYFLDEGYRQVHRLPLDSKKETEHVRLVIYLLASAFLSKNKNKFRCSMKAQQRLLRWSKTIIAETDIPEKLEFGIRLAVQEWPAEGTGVAARESNSAVQSEPKKHDADTAPSSAKKEPQNENVANGTQGKKVEGRRAEQYDAIVELNRLADFLKKQERTLSTTTRRLEKAKKDSNNQRMKLTENRREQERLTTRLAGERRALETSEREKGRLADELVVLRKDLELKNAELEKSKKQESDNAHLHEEQTSALSERIAREGEHHAAIFKKQLGRRLKPYDGALRDAKNMEMSKELGSTLIIQLQQIIKILKSEGVNVGGDKQ